MKYKYILIDLDNTILDFHAAEKNAHRLTSQKFNLQWNDEFYNVYHKINDDWWKRHEKGECTREEIVINRFKEYLNFMDSNIDPVIFNEEYYINLSKGRDVMPGANQLIKTLYDMGAKLFIASNGSLNIQKSRLKGQKFLKYFSGEFISQELGFQKPTKEFFDKARQKVGIDFNSQNTLIIGDSLTSDILGGVNANIDTLWVNQNGKENYLNLPITYTVTSLEQIPKLLK